MKKFIGYIRVSTKEQAQEGVSLAAQEAKIRAYCSLYDMELVGVKVDAGKSAKNMNRPALQECLELMEAGEVHGIIVTKLDRLTRSIRDMGDLIQTYFRKNWDLVSVSEQVNTDTASGRMILNIMMTISQWEREVIGERTSEALQQLKSEGVRLGQVPYSDPEGLSLMRAWRSQGASYRQICRELESAGFLTQRGKSTWHPQTVKDILG